MLLPCLFIIIPTQADDLDRVSTFYGLVLGSMKQFTFFVYII